MDGSTILEIAKALGIILGAVAFGLLTYWRLKERALREELGLKANPERCGRHEERLDQLEGLYAELSQQNRLDHKDMGDKISALTIAITKISRNGNP